MSFSLVKSSDALLQREQRFIDFCAVNSGLLAHIHVISTSLVASQINEGDFSEQLFPFFQGDLQDGMRP